MRNIFLFIVFVCFAPILSGQKYENLYDSFFVLELSEEGSDIIAIVRTNPENWTIDEHSIGDLLPVHANNSTKKNESLGSVEFLKMEEGSVVLKIKSKNIEGAKEALVEGNGQIRIRVISSSGAKGTLVYDMYRLGIGIFDRFGEENLLKNVPTFVKKENSADEEIIPNLLEDIVLVAKAMKGQMESPIVKEGKFEGMDLFTAMEKSSYWDIVNFLTYAKSNPFKYQGVDWKIGEIYATWIDGGSPGNTNMQKESIYPFVLEKLLGNEGYDDKVKFLNGIDRLILKTICSDLRMEVDNCLENKKSGCAYKHYHAARDLARYLNDEEEIAWGHYKHGQICTEIESFDSAVEELQKAAIMFEKIDNKAGIVIINNEIGRTYNLLNTIGGYKKALKPLNSALDIAKEFPKNNKVISPVTAMVFQNLGESYLGLNKTEKALESFEDGLKYTNASGAKSLKRKATLLYKIAEAYEIMGNKDLKEKFETQAIETYKEYEDEIAKIKKL